MYNFGLGLMHETFKHFGFEHKVTFEKIKEDGTHVRFFIEKGDDYKRSGTI